MDELREKVIRGMECSICPNAACGDCGYFIRYENVPETGYCDRDAIYRDALSLLKAQDEKESEWVKMTGMMPPEYTGHYQCGNCGWHGKHDKENEYKFCPECGAKMKNAVKWK